ncbi:Ras GTPase-activating-like protein iqgap2 [Halocaridina rubra]|uniref:Ras GTPase-activating-like protein iqgap2 n=1 Tax=Halocaridina rubra TaxID=373956 RepID=A0AAN8X2S4_HALRR
MKKKRCTPRGRSARSTNKKCFVQNYTTGYTGIFYVQVKFMGVPMENIEIDIQLQYEGVSVKKMFAKVIVNVNLLLHLLNSKFYSKKK